MTDPGQGAGDEARIVEVLNTQLQHFAQTVPPCRGLQLPDGILLRHTLSASLYFYLRTAVENGKIKTTVFASDSPYDRQKAVIGTVTTPMFEARADHLHLERLEALVRSWVDFVRDDPGADSDFRTFNL